MAQNDRQNDKQTDGHGDSMTDPAQRAESVKSELKLQAQFLQLTSHFRKISI